MSSFFRPNFRLSLSLSLSKKKINAAEARHRALLQNGPNDDWQKWLPANWRSLPQYKIYKGAPYCGPCRFWDSKVGAPAGDESACRCEWFIFSSTFFFFFFFFEFFSFRRPMKRWMGFRFRGLCLWLAPGRLSLLMKASRVHESIVGVPFQWILSSDRSL